MKNGVPIQEPDLIKWGLWFEDHNDQRMVERTKIGDAEISTVFLGLNHAFGEGPPLLYETMVFGGALEGEMLRTATLEEAKAAHEHLSARVKSV